MSLCWCCHPWAATSCRCGGHGGVQCYAGDTCRQPGRHNAANNAANISGPIKHTLCSLCSRWLHNPCLPTPSLASHSPPYPKQVIKRGVTELADIVVINKADGATKPAAARAAAAFKSTVHFHRQRRRSWQPAVLTLSAHTGVGVDKLQATLQEYEAVMAHSGELAQVSVLLLLGSVCWLGG